MKTRLRRFWERYYDMMTVKRNVVRDLADRVQTIRKRCPDCLASTEVSRLCNRHVENPWAEPPTQEKVR